MSFKGQVLFTFPEEQYSWAAVLHSGLQTWPGQTQQLKKNQNQFYFISIKYKSINICYKYQLIKKIQDFLNAISTAE